MSGKKITVAIDTNIFIYYFQQHYLFGNSSKKLLSSIEKEKSKTITSLITLIELLSFQAPEATIAKLQLEYVNFPNLLTIDVNYKIALEAARIRRVYGYKTADAIQLATALFAKADVFITNDKRLQKFKEIEVRSLGE